MKCLRQSHLVLTPCCASLDNSQPSTPLPKGWVYFGKICSLVITYMNRIYWEHIYLYLQLRSLHILCLPSCIFLLFKIFKIPPPPSLISAVHMHMSAGHHLPEHEQPTRGHTTEQSWLSLNHWLTTVTSSSLGVEFHKLLLLQFYAIWYLPIFMLYDNMRRCFIAKKISSNALFYQWSWLPKFIMIVWTVQLIWIMKKNLGYYNNRKV